MILSVLLFLAVFITSSEGTNVVRPNMRPDDFREATVFNLPVFLPAAGKDLPKIPPYFDASKAWPDCVSIGHIRDQGHCGTCYAVASTSAIADRLCIATYKKNDWFNGFISVSEAASCPFKREKDTDNCEVGSDTSAVYRYAITNGLPTGGDFSNPLDVKSSCLPYPVDPAITSTANLTPLKCTKACKDPKAYPIPYDKDLHKIASYWMAFQPSGAVMSDAQIKAIMELMQRDIMANGPLTVSIMALDELKDVGKDHSVYTHKTAEGQRILTDHNVRITGWGPSAEEKDRAPYWIVANSWGVNAGDKGFFRIERGKNIVGIESQVSAPIVLSPPHACTSARFCAAVDQAFSTDIRNGDAPVYLIQGECAQQVKIVGEKVNLVDAAFPITQTFLPARVNTGRAHYQANFDGFWLFDADKTGGMSCVPIPGTQPIKYDCTPGFGPKKPTVQVCLPSKQQNGKFRACWTYDVIDHTFKLTGEDSPDIIPSSSGSKSGQASSSGSKSGQASSSGSKSGQASGSGSESDHSSKSGSESDHSSKSDSKSGASSSDSESDDEKDVGVTFSATLTDLAFLRMDGGRKMAVFGKGVKSGKLSVSILTLPVDIMMRFPILVEPSPISSMFTWCPA